MELADIHSFVMLCSITCHQKYVSGGLFSYRMSNFAFNKRTKAAPQPFIIWGDTSTMKNTKQCYLSYPLLDITTPTQQTHVLDFMSTLNAAYRGPKGRRFSQPVEYHENTGIFQDVQVTCGVGSWARRKKKQRECELQAQYISKILWNRSV